VLDFAQGFKNFPDTLTVHPTANIFAIPTGTGDEGNPPPPVVTLACNVPQGCSNTAAVDGGCIITCG
jgi:hypothetical protein